jgi:hypothetical protein
VRTAAVATVRPLGSAPAADHDGRADVTACSLADLLAAAVAEAPSMQLVLLGGERVTGVLRAAGADVVTLGPPSGGALYVSIASIAEAFRSG